MPQTDESALEKTFSDLAYSHLRDKAQGLLDYLVGFQMLKQEDDGQRAVGIFGFEIDGDYYYAPTFFLNGEIRGLDSLYSVKSDLFVPITDSWVSSIIDRRQVRLGDPDTRSRGERGVHTPNYSRLKVIPGGGGSINLKLGSAMKLAEQMMGDRPDVESIDLPSVLSSAGVAGHFKAALDASPRLQEHFEGFGYNYLDLADVAPQQKRAAEEAVVIINTITDEGATELSDDEKAKVLEGGTAVIDNRPEVATAQLYRTETEDRLFNPSCGGLHDVLYSDGSVCLSLVVPVNDGTNNVFVYCTETEKYCIIPSRKVFALRQYSREELIDWLKDKAKSPSDVRPGEVVVFVSDEGQGTGGFCVNANNTGLDDITSLHTQDSHCMETSSCCAVACGGGRGDNGNPESNTFQNIPDRDHYGASRPKDPNCRVKTIVVTESGGASPRYTEKQLVVNDRRFWALKINTFKMRESEHGQYQNEEYGEPRYDVVMEDCDFGDCNTVKAALDKVASDLKTWKTGSEITVKVANETHSFRKEADGLRVLMKGLDLTEADARTIMKEACAVQRVYKYAGTTKEAAELLEIPDMEDTDLGGFMTSNFREQVPYLTVSQAQSPQNREFYQYQSPFGGGATDAEQVDTFAVLDTAGKTGQKDVFDAAALGSLIKNHNPTDLVDRFLPTITAGMDRIGRMLFLIYWHYTDFEDRYGENDLSEFIDNLRAVFEQLGDIIIFAKKRTLAGDPEAFGLGASPVMEKAS